MIVTRFAPSPTGYLHVGGARTALFAWAFARKHGGRFLLRIEDTDTVRSDKKHSDAIIAALNWLDLNADEPPVFQSDNAARHRQLITRLLHDNAAYQCYCSPQELAQMREQQLARGESPRYDRRWRDSDQPPPADVAPVVRFKAPLSGDTRLHDDVKGEIVVANSELDDWIIARADGSPTYNFAAVADDIDMGITHVIRGDDHLMNTFRQWHLFQALTPTPPRFAHLPMLLAPRRDGDTVRYERMSKRNAATDIGVYRDNGFLPAALCNYLARLSWSHGDAEFFDRAFFVNHFGFAAVQQSPARFDMNKLRWLNREHLRQLSPAAIRRAAGLDDDVSDEVLALAVVRADTLADVGAEVASFTQRPPAAVAANYLAADNAAAFDALDAALSQLREWTPTTIKKILKETATAHALPFKRLGMPLRLLLLGKTDSADVAAVAAALGREETLARLQARLNSGQ